MGPASEPVLYTVRLLERVHGHIGWLTVAALIHPVVVLGRGRIRRGKRAVAAVFSATGLTTVTFALGMATYGDYRLRLKRGLFESMPSLGWLFERKEHIGFAVLALSWLGATAYAGALLAPAFGTLAATRDPLCIAARRAFAAAAALAFAAAAFGTGIAAYRSF